VERTDETLDATKLAEVLAGQEPGQAVSVTVTRDGAEHAARLTLGELPGA
jgi:S1-C subfamily serine protease